ncbi:MAG: alanyl-tRNA editing protein [Alphaproteobacteria bacterium]|nr:alanyl-tRNA editing protein [Alphaproteobacteria bacterium]MCB9929908.1 alanyl-tRNA editing protein [Alphaproteobacteria bacterium]
MELVFRDNPYATECEATVVAAGPDGVVLDRTVFYPTGGGQPGDSGVLISGDGTETAIAEAVKGEGPEDVLHRVAEGAPLPAVGSTVTARIDWERRHRHMRMHTAMHLLCSMIHHGVTGGQVGAEKSRLDFDSGDHVYDKEELTEKLNGLIAADYAVTSRWIDESELDENPDLVRTLSVQPPRGTGRIRLMAVGEGAIDLQPCGGTHVARTGEIGRVRVAKIENKGKRNRRINIVFEQ